MRQSVEDRLAAALEARAEQVRPEDLRPLGMPNRRGRARSRTVILLSAAAAAVAIAVPFLVARLDSGESGTGPVGPPSTTVSPPTPSAPTATSGSPEAPPNDVLVGRQHADVDGDGLPDQVSVSVGSRGYDEDGGVVEVVLASGPTATAPLPPGYPPRLLAPFDINRDGRQQVLLSHTAGGDEAQLLVYVWLDGTLVRATHDNHAPLALGLDGQGTYADYYTDDHGLFSWLRGEPLNPGGWPMFYIDLWSWTLDGDQLVATRAGRGCLDVTSHAQPGRCG